MSAEMLMLKGLISEMSESQKELFEKHKAGLDEYKNTLINSSEDEKAALTVAITMFIHEAMEIIE